MQGGPPKVFACSVCWFRNVVITALSKSGKVKGESEEEWEREKEKEGKNIISEKET